MLSHISASSSSTAFCNLRSSLFLNSPKRFHLCPSFPIKSPFRHSFPFSFFSPRCSMDSPSTAAAVDSISDDLRNQTLNSTNSNSNNGDSNNSYNKNDKGVKLALEELNWDHSFVRELPGDPRTDIIPREVCYLFICF